MENDGDKLDEEFIGLFNEISVVSESSNNMSILMPKYAETRSASLVISSDLLDWKIIPVKTCKEKYFGFGPGQKTVMRQKMMMMLKLMKLVQLNHRKCLTGWYIQNLQTTKKTP